MKTICEFAKDCPAFKEEGIMCNDMRVRNACSEYHYRKSGTSLYKNDGK